MIIVAVYLLNTQKRLLIMKVCGIIAEYDPFHKGHAWQIEQAKKLSGADYVICVMSMTFTQRGMPALLYPHDRAQMALLGGADLVLGVPYAFSVCDAERFALGGVEILRRCGIVHALSFGIEEEGLDAFADAAKLLENPTEDYLKTLRSKLNQGLPYPRAQGEALAYALHKDANVFSLPNTSLAICYARAVQQTQAAFSLHPVIRKGSYHDTALQDDTCAFSSASAIRAAIQNEKWHDVSNALPAQAFDVLMKAKKEKRVQLYQPLDALLRWRLRNDAFDQLPDCSEGIENRFREAANANTRDEMVLSIKTKRYTYARINRLMAHVLTQTNKAAIFPLPQYAYVLGFKKSAAHLLHAIDEKSLTLLHRLPTGPLSPMLELDRRADDLWAIGAQQPFGALYRAKPVILNDL